MLDLAAPQRRRAGRRAADRHPDRLRRSCWCSATCSGRRPGGRRWTRRCRTPRSRWTRFVDAAFTGGPADRRRARRRNYRALTELQTQLQRRLAEPPPISTRAAAWWPVIVAAGADVGRRHRGGHRRRARASPAPDLAQVAVLRRAIRQLEDDVRDHRHARRRRDPTPRACWRPVAREVDAARRLVRENAPGRRACR